MTRSCSPLRSANCVATLAKPAMPGLASAPIAPYSPAAGGTSPPPGGAGLLQALARASSQGPLPGW